MSVSLTGAGINQQVATSPGMFNHHLPDVFVTGDSDHIATQVDRDGGTDGAVSCKYTTHDGTAIAGVDYTAADQVLNFSDGQGSSGFTIFLSGNPPDVPISFTVVLNTPTGGATIGGDATMTVTINP
jgi:hypothetical protein